jgi:hypothetical protein
VNRLNNWSAPVDLTSKLQRRGHPFSTSTHYLINYSFFNFSIWLFIHSFILTLIYSPFIYHSSFISRSSLIHREVPVSPYPFSLDLTWNPTTTSSRPQDNQNINMRVTNILSAALVAGPLAVSAAGILGFAVGNTNPDNSCKTQKDYEMDMEALKGVTTVVRTYTSGGCNTAKAIVPAAKAKGFQVVLGVWSVMTNSCTRKLGLTNVQARHGRVLRRRQESASSSRPWQRGHHLCHHSRLRITIPWKLHRRGAPSKNQ